MLQMDIMSAMLKCKPIPDRNSAPVSPVYKKLSYHPWNVQWPMSTEILITATLNISNNFEVSIPIHYEDIKGDTTQNIENGAVWDSQGSLEIAPFDRAYMNSY